MGDLGAARANNLAQKLIDSGEQLTDYELTSQLDRLRSLIPEKISEQRGIEVGEVEQTVNDTLDYLAGISVLEAGVTIPGFSPHF